VNPEPFLQLDRVIHEKGRLAIMSLLAASPEVSFTELRQTLSMTDGNLMARILNFMGWLIQEKRLGHIRLIDRNVALARAHICAQCPRQRSLPTSCGSCKASVATSRRGILDGQDPVHQGISVCGALQEDVCTVVHLAVPQRHDESLPAACWRRNC
jgi:hypothetical protein